MFRFIEPSSDQFIKHSTGTFNECAQCALCAQCAQCALAECTSTLFYKLA